MVGKKKIKPKIFYNFSLDKFVPEDDFYRKLDKLLNLSFLYKDCKDIYGKTGNPSIDPVVFFKILIVGYLENIIYDRQLAKKINDSLSIRLFLGYDIDEDTPWHSTISRTRARIPIEIYDKVFSYMLRVCIKHNLVMGGHVSIDSTLIKANASLDSLERKMPECTIEEYNKKTRILNLPEKKNRGVNKKRGNNTHISKKDPDSRITKKPGTPVDLYYKGNISVDPKNGIIIHPEVTYGDVNDSRIIGRIVEASKSRLEENNLNLKSVSADKAYCIGKTLRELENLNVYSYIPLVKRTTNTDVWTVENFIYDRKNDFYICPNGKKLNYKDNNGRSKRYKASYIDCKICSFKKKCITKEQARLLFHPVYKDEFERLEERLNTSMAIKALIWRKNAERVIGELKNNIACKKINTIGKANAQKKLIMASFTYNLKKFIKYGYKFAASPSCFSKFQLSKTNLISFLVNLSPLSWILAVNRFRNNHCKLKYIFNCL